MATVVSQTLCQLETSAADAALTHRETGLATLRLDIRAENAAQ